MTYPPIKVDRQRQTTMGPERGGALIICVTWILVSWVLYESLNPFAAVDGWSEAAQRLGKGVTVFTVPVFWGHVAAFASLGIALALNHRWRGIQLIGLCLTIEILQATSIERHPRTGDLLVNLFVSGAAFLSTRKLVKRQQLESWMAKYSTTLARLLFFGFVGFVGVVTVKAEEAISLTTWQPEFALHLGDEATLDRPWAGEFKGVAIYSSALDADTVSRLASQPFSGRGLSLRREIGAVALFAIASPPGSEIRDRSGVTPELNLDVAADRPVDQPYYFSKRAVEKISAAARSGADFSVEIKGRSANLEQTGPARLVSLSDGPLHRNFMLGQQEHSLYFRVRSPVAGENGSVGEGRWPEVFSDDAVYDLIASYQHGRMRLFKNGLPFGRPIIQRGSWSGLGSNCPVLALTLLFVPLGLLCRIAWPDAARRFRVMALASIGVSTAALGLFLAHVYFDTEFEISLPVIGLVGVLVGDGLAGRLLRSASDQRRDSSH